MWSIKSKMYFKLAAILCFTLFSKTTDAIVCYSCKDLPHPSDCGSISECGSHEVCYVEHMISQDGSSTYNSGCRDKTRCLSGGFPAVGKRQAETIIPCSKCCNSSYCNTNTCDDRYKPSTSGVRCLSCNDVLSPDDCRSVMQCSQDSMCYTQAFRVNDEVRYRLGCAPKSYCSSNITTTTTPQLPTIPGLPFGRAVKPLGALFGTPCASGCSEENCNRDLCINSTGCSLTRLPISDKCEDISKYGCILIVSLAAEQGDSACSNPDIRNLCPASCGICTNPIITQGPVVNPNVTVQVTNPVTAATVNPQFTTVGGPVTPSTDIPTPTNMFTPNACGDYFSEYACHKVDCEIQICKDNDLRSLCSNYCIGRCMSRDCTDIPGFIPSEIKQI